jgi:hypothetical protein
MSVDAKLFTSPVIKMAISIGFCWDDAPVSLEAAEQPAVLISKASLGKDHRISLIIISVSFGLPAPLMD